MPPPRRAAALAALLVLVACGLNTALLLDSAALEIPFVFGGSDMSSNLKWAETIRDQGWLNPEPHHPYAGWMREVGTREEWAGWWGGTATFHTAPLYPYLLAASIALFDDLRPMHWLQALWAALLCAALGWISFRLTGKPLAGVGGMLLAAAYAPFHGYSFPLLRDFLGWLLTAAVLVAGMELDARGEDARPRRWWALALGAALGLGLWARETFLLIVPAAAALAGRRLLRARDLRGAALLGLPVLCCLLLLGYRNARAGAPLLAVSNRLAENIVIGNAGSAHPAAFKVPAEMRALLLRAEGSPARLWWEAARTHPSAWSWLWLQARKVLSLFDPNEAYDNVSLDFLGHLSPFVRWGVRHWMVVVPGVVGLALGLLLRDRRHLWLWALWPAVGGGVLITVPLSRYRQSLMVLWIPWAVYAAAWLVEQARQRRWRSLLVPAGACLLGWAAALGARGRIAPEEPDRPHEYQMAIQIYDAQGDRERADQMRELLKERFPAAPERP